MLGVSAAWHLLCFQHQESRLVVDSGTLRPTTTPAPFEQTTENGVHSPHYATSLALTTATYSNCLPCAVLLRFITSLLEQAPHLCLNKPTSTPLHTRRCLDVCPVPRAIVGENTDRSQYHPLAAKSHRTHTALSHLRRLHTLPYLLPGGSFWAYIYSRSFIATHYYTISCSTSARCTARPNLTRRVEDK